MHTCVITWPDMYPDLNQWLTPRTPSLKQQMFEQIRDKRSRERGSYTEQETLRAGNCTELQSMHIRATVHAFPCTYSDNPPPPIIPGKKKIQKVPKFPFLPKYVVMWHTILKFLLCLHTQEEVPCFRFCVTTCMTSDIGCLMAKSSQDPEN